MYRSDLNWMFPTRRAGLGKVAENTVVAVCSDSLHYGMPFAAPRHSSRYTHTHTHTHTHIQQRLDGGIAVNVCDRIHEACACDV